MRKALCVGIDSYKVACNLHGCVNDANGVKAVLERNGDGMGPYARRCEKTELTAPPWF